MTSVHLLRAAVSTAVPGSALENIRPPPAALSWKYALELSVVLAAYFVAGQVGLAVPYTSGNVSPVWPAAGIALAALLLVGYRVWPAIAAGAFLVNFPASISPGAVITLAAGNTAGPVVGAWLLRRLPGFRSSLSRLHDVLALILIAAPVTAAISATVGVTVLFVAHVDPWLRFWPAWGVWWLGDTMGVLLVAPLALTLLKQKRITRARHVPELVAVLSAVVITCLVSFDSRTGLGVGKDVLAFAVLPLVLWGATRFETTQREDTEQSEQRSREIIDTANDGIWMLDAELRTVLVNPRMADILGYTVEEMRGKPLSRFMSAAAWEQKQAALQLRSAAREQAQAQYTRKDGSSLWATVTRTRAFAEDGTFMGVLEMVSDIGGQKRAEMERQDALDRVVLLSKAVEQTADSVLISDGAGHIEYVNPAFEGTTGYTREEVVGKTPRFLRSGHHADAFYQQMWEGLLAGEVYRGTLVNRKKSGELYCANQTITPIKDAQGTVTHFVAVLKDVTEARKYHEQEVRLRLARAVQERFNPSAPRLPGFDIAAASYPANETGGDYFDFIEAPHGVLYVAVGDVSGHGFDAALIMALTRAYMRSFTTLGMDVGEVLGRVNRALVGDLEESRFVTMLLVRLDVEAGNMTYASAGHIPGVILNGSEGIDRVMESTGVPLGLFADSIFASRQCRFKQQQILVLGTDGATETADANGVEFGRDGVIEFVRAHANDTAGQIAAGVYSAARTFSAGEQHDDITSVIIKVTKAAHGVEQAALPLEIAAA